MIVALTVGEGPGVTSIEATSVTVVESALLVLAKIGFTDPEFGVTVQLRRKTPVAMSNAQPARDAICCRENVHFVFGG